MTFYYQNNHPDTLPLLIKSVIDGDKRSFKILYDMITPKMYGICMRHTINDNDANDYFQEAMVKVYLNLSSYQHAGSFEGWAKTICENHCRSEIKKKATFQSIEITPDMYLEKEGPEAYNKLSMDELVTAVRSLPDACRLIVNLYFVEGYKHREIAEMLDINENTCKYHVQQGKQLLRKNLQSFI